MKISSIFAIFILSAIFLLMLFSSFDDSATFDEVAHIGSGYTYLKELDGRLNPEHPPLIKYLSALPLFALPQAGELNFDKNQNFWTWENVNDRQWAAGKSLLYESGNDADKILLYSRLPIMILAVVFGLILFWWTRKNYGDKVGILTLLFYALSPTFLAHSRYVTTDLGAAFAFFLSVVFFVRFLERNDKKSAVWFGLVFGLSLLVKFSLVILGPFFVIIGIIYNSSPPLTVRGVVRQLAEGVELISFVKKFFIVFLTSLIIVYLFYIPLIWNYPPEQNLTDAKFTIGNYKTAQFAPELDFWLLKHKFTQPIGQYLHGFLMATQRTAGGNNAYFLGEVSNKGRIHYFPVLFFTKEQIGLYILVLLAVILALKNKKNLEDKKTIIFLVFIAYYWAWSLWSPLNIGIRHILPTFPFIYILVSKSIIKWVNKNYIKKIFLATIFIWMAADMALVYPYFLSYYNQLFGGWKVGYKIATDSNYDWGQDLKRLSDWTTQNGISKVYLDYFGGGSPHYYLGNKYEFWRHEKGSPPAGSHFAVSANSLFGAEDLYYWLKDKKPTARAGSSIFIFKF